MICTPLGKSMFCTPLAFSEERTFRQRMFLIKGHNNDICVIASIAAIHF